MGILERMRTISKLLVRRADTVEQASKLLIAHNKALLKVIKERVMEGVDDDD